eukprot:216745-Pelagomonas_calceolata.AAC.1
MVGMKFIALELRWLCSDELCTQHCKGVTRVKRGWPSWMLGMKESSDGGLPPTGSGPLGRREDSATAAAGKAPRASAETGSWNLLKNGTQLEHAESKGWHRSSFLYLCCKHAAASWNKWVLPLVKSACARMRKTSTSRAVEPSMIRESKNGKIRKHPELAFHAVGLCSDQKQSGLHGPAAEVLISEQSFLFLPWQEKSESATLAASAHAQWTRHGLIINDLMTLWPAADQASIFSLMTCCFLRRRCRKQPCAAAGLQDTG